MKVITVSNFKGGVAKTTTAVNLAVIFAEQGLRTLAIDLDPQASLTDYLGLYAAAESGKSAIDLLYGNEPVSACAHATKAENLSCVPARIGLIDQNELLLAEQSLRFALDDAADDFDVVIIDCAPSMKRLALCAYAATSGRGLILVPVKLESSVMRGTASAVELAEGVATKLRIPKPDWRILRTCVPGRMTNAEATGAQILNRFFPDAQCQTVIHQSTKVAEGSWSWEPVVTYAPACRPAEDYRQLAKEVLA